MGTLFVVATPIGNLEDFSPRAQRILREVRLIAAEDTRHSRRLLAHFSIDTPLISYHQHNQRERRQALLDALAVGDVALITDAGTPAISDPGADLVNAALAGGFSVSPIPGPSALTAAISASGLIDGPFVSLGFLPRDRPERKVVIGRAAAGGLPLIIFESARRLGATLRDLLSALGDRPAVAMRELTKLYEEIVPGSLSEIQEWASSTVPRGEVVLVVAGANHEQASREDAESVVLALRKSGLSPSLAAREAAAITGLPRSDLYRIAVTIGAPKSLGLEGELALSDEDALQESLGNQKRPKRRKS